MLAEIHSGACAGIEAFGVSIEVNAGVFCNAQMPSRLLQRMCRMEAAAESLLRTAMQELQLSARAYDRILKVARTVADLAGREGIVAGDVAEAVGYRSLDRPMV